MGEQLRFGYDRAGVFRGQGAAARFVRCPACGHEGVILRSVPLGARLKCSACGTALAVRQAVGPRPARFHQASPQRSARDTAREIFQRYGSPALDDRLDDLWPLRS